MRRAPAGCPFAPRCAWRLDDVLDRQPGPRCRSIAGDTGRHDRPDGDPPDRLPQPADRRGGASPAVRCGAGFVAAPPPAGVIDEVGAGHLGGRDDDLEALVGAIQAEEGPISMAPSAGALPLPPEGEHQRRRGLP